MITFRDFRWSTIGLEVKGQARLKAVKADMCLSGQACLNEEINLSGRHEEDIHTAHDMLKECDSDQCIRVLCSLIRAGWRIDFCDVLIAFLEKERKSVREDGGKLGAQSDYRRLGLSATPRQGSTTWWRKCREHAIEC